MRRQFIRILLFAILSFTILFSSIHADKKDLWGIWRGELNGKEYKFKFNADKTCELSIIDKASGSVTSIDGNFETDFSKRPVPLTIRNIPQLNHPLHTILLFKGDGTMMVGDFAPRWRLRPIAFSKHTSIVLYRVEED